MTFQQPIENMTRYSRTVRGFGFGSGTAFAAARERVRNPFHRGHGNLELTIARSSGTNCRDCSEPLEHAKSALFHTFEVSRCSTFHFKKGQRVAPAGRYA